MWSRLLVINSAAVPSLVPGTLGCRAGAGAAHSDATDPDSSCEFLEGTDPSDDEHLDSVDHDLEATDPSDDDHPDSANSDVEVARCASETASCRDCRDLPRRSRIPPDALFLGIQKY